MKKLGQIILINFLVLSTASAASSEPKLEHYASNGCSVPDLFSSKSYLSCCTQHDFAYWVGGDEDAKKRADASLINCILSKGASSFTAGIWQSMLTKFGSHRFGARWTPRRSNTPLTEREWGEVSRLSGDLQSEIPIVRNYNKSGTCSKELIENLINLTNLKKPKDIVCYDLVNNTGYLKKHAKLVYSNECNIGYFVFQFERNDRGYVKNESLAGYGLCHDKIKLEKKTYSLPQVNYLVAPPLQSVNQIQ